MNELKMPWPINEFPDQEIISIFLKDFKSAVSESFFEKLFKEKKKEALETFKLYCEKNPEKLAEISDLILKWAFLNTFDSKILGTIEQILDFLEYFLEKMGEFEHKLYAFEVSIVNGISKNLIINYNDNFIEKIIGIQDKMISVYRAEKLSKYWSDIICKNNDRNLKRQVFKLFEVVFFPFCKKEFPILSKPFMDPSYNSFVNKLIENYGESTLINAGFSIKFEEEKSSKNEKFIEKVENFLIKILFL